MPGSHHAGDLNSATSRSARQGDTRVSTIARPKKRDGQRERRVPLRDSHQCCRRAQRRPNERHRVWDLRLNLRPGTDTRDIAV